MIDFKEKLHKDVNEILGESVQLDEGLRSGLKSIKNGIVSTKNKIDTFQHNRKIKSQEKALLVAISDFIDLIYTDDKKMGISLKKLARVKSIDDAVKELGNTKLIIAQIEKRINNYINYLKAQDKNLKGLD